LGLLLCGGGRGPPKDATDRCCAVNDCCYKKLKNRRCGTTSLKYSFTLCWSLIVCDKGGIVKMQTRHRKLLTFSNGGSGCKGGECHYDRPEGHLSLALDWELLDGCTTVRMDYCKHQVCECDQIAILCSARNKKTYNKKLQYYSNRQCKGSTPKCLRSP
ncbi:phospholipase A2, membrane associated-like, partial [Bos javanicus]|uniref:phospholipase A2, membrane associated-like n=1 Tax=Bos javanicus TaxID=9906 RepID=UPI002AA7B1CA